MPIAHNYGPTYFDGEKTTSNPSVPAPFNSIGSIDGSFGRLSVIKSEGIKGDKGWVYGWDNKPMQYINDDDRDLMQDELHAQWAVKKLKELETRSNNQPFFMGVGFVRPHTPLHAPDKYFDMFPLDEIQLEKWMVDDEKYTFYLVNNDPDDDSNNKGPRYYRMLLESYNGDRELALKHFLQAYLACVAFVDEQIGKVVDALNSSEFKDNTIIVLTSDHGWQMGEKKYLFKNSPWEESARIPMVIKTPNSKAGLKIEHPVSLIDLFPTLSDYCHLKGTNKINDQGGDLGGYSLRPFIEQHPKQWKGLKGAFNVVGNYGVDIPTEKQNFSYRTKQWCYIKYSNVQEELYNHKKDSDEWYNLAYEKKYQKTKIKLAKEMNNIITNR